MVIKKGDILAFKGRGFASALIRFGTKSKYTHVEIADSDYLSIGARFDGVKGRSIEKLKEKGEEFDVYEIDRSVEPNYDPEKAARWFVRQLDRKYDFWGLVGLGFLKTLALLKIKVDWKTYQRDRDYFCSELVLLGTKVGYCRFNDVKQDHKASPADIVNSKSTKFKFSIKMLS